MCICLKAFEFRWYEFYHSASKDLSIRLWNLKTMQTIAIMTGFEHCNGSNLSF
ncbi:hypothetical protein RhiirC2_739572 [Rhizophagus irregularis]|uniref:Uncharacterized protein n=1 Tax=Rhizophagus irregularis TaxID=588596 RepID=A0A2N1NJP0_9GLOM|nr:hypothetical protein RhiirC2_739572 [Rhizophagus irregularis]